MTDVENAPPKVAVIILTMNQREKTLQCLASFRSVKHPLFTIVLWDNGSGDGTSEAVGEAYPEVLVHCHETNLGVASGRNAAAELAIRTFAPSHLLFIDNDTVVTPDFLTALLKPFENDPRLAQTAPKLRLFSDTQRLDEAGGTKITFWLGRVVVVGSGEMDEGQYDTPAECIAGGCTLIRTDLFQQVGGFDSQFDPYGPEDLDFSLRVRNAGYYALYVPQSLIFHDRSRTGVGRAYSETYARNKARQWFLLLRRHASFAEQLAFVFIGTPYVLLRVLMREGKKGNLSALRGLIRGILDWTPMSLRVRQKDKEPR